MQKTTSASTHSLERGKQRLNLNKKATLRQIQLAFERGQTSETIGSLGKYWLQDHSANGKNAKIYNGFCFIFGNNGMCITILPLPEYLSKKPYFDNKNQIRNIRYYTKDLRLKHEGLSY